MNPSELDRCFLSGVEQGAGVREKTGRELYSQEGGKREKEGKITQYCATEKKVQRGGTQQK